MSPPWRWRLTVAAVLAAAAATGAAAFSIDGLAVDPLTEPEASARILPPPLRVNLDEEISRMAQRSFQAPPPTPPEIEQAKRHYERALAYAQEKEPAKALIELRDGLALTPDDPQMLGMAAALSVQLRNFEDAAAFFRRQLDIESVNLHAAAAYVAVLIRLARFEEADAVLRRFEGAVPQFMPFRFHRLCLDVLADRPLSGDGYWQRRSFEEIATVTQWLVMDRDDLARSLGTEGFLRLTSAILGPNAVDTMRDVAAAIIDVDRARGSRNWPVATEAARRLVANGVGPFGVRAVLAEALEQSGARTEALAEWRAIVRDFGDMAQAWVSAAHVFLRNGRFDEALTMARRAKELAPREAVIDFLTASALALNNQVGDAQPIFAELLARRPREFRRWLESDAVFEAALARLPNHAAFLRRLDIPPELE